MPNENRVRTLLSRLREFRLVSYFNRDLARLQNGSIVQRKQNMMRVHSVTYN
jgi:hypothetical protein